MPLLTYKAARTWLRNIQNMVRTDGASSSADALVSILTAALLTL